MAKKLGNDYLLYVGDGAGTEVFTALTGQGDFDLDGSTQQIDTSDKTTAGYATGAPGLTTATASIKMMADLPNTALTRLLTQFKAKATVNVQLRKAPFAVGDLEWVCSVYVTQFKRTYPLNGVVSIDAVLTPAAAPTVDTLS